MNQQEPVSGKARRVVRISLELLRRFFVVNPLLKLISLGIALLIWFSVSSEQAQRDITLYNVPLQVNNTRNDLVVTALAYRAVDLRVRGPAHVISNLKADDMSVSVDVSRLTPGHRVIWLDLRDVRGRSEVEVLRIDPPSIPILLERLVTRSVPVIPRLEKRGLSSNYTVTGCTVEPNSVEIVGPESVVENLTGINTKEIPLEAANSPVVLTAQLDTSPVGSVRVNPSEVKVTVLVEGVVEKRFSQVPVKKSREIISSLPSSVDVIITGPRSAVDRVDRRDVVAAINAGGLDSGSYEVSPVVEVRAPVAAQLQAIRTDPEKVSIRVR